LVVDVAGTPLKSTVYGQSAKSPVIVTVVPPWVLPDEGVTVYPAAKREDVRSRGRRGKRRDVRVI
jgi:hypothetical protein